MSTTAVTVLVQIHMELCEIGNFYICQVNGVKLVDILFSLLCVCLCVCVRP